MKVLTSDIKMPSLGDGLKLPDVPDGLTPNVAEGLKLPGFDEQEEDDDITFGDGDEDENNEDIKYDYNADCSIEEIMRIQTMNNETLQKLDEEFKMKYINIFTNAQLNYIKKLKRSRDLDRSIAAQLLSRQKTQQNIIYKGNLDAGTQQMPLVFLINGTKYVYKKNKYKYVNPNTKQTKYDDYKNLCKAVELITALVQETKCRNLVSDIKCIKCKDYNDKLLVDANNSQSSITYVREKLIDGSTLSKYLIESSDIYNFYDIILQIAYTINLMHSHNIYHNDLHHKNIMITRLSKPIELKWNINDNVYTHTTQILVTIIDYGYITHPTPLNTNYGEQKTITTPILDILQLFASISDSSNNINANTKQNIKLFIMYIIQFFNIKLVSKNRNSIMMESKIDYVVFINLIIIICVYFCNKHAYNTLN